MTTTLGLGVLIALGTCLLLLTQIGRRLVTASLVAILASWVSGYVAASEIMEQVHNLSSGPIEDTGQLMVFLIGFSLGLVVALIIISRRKG